MVRSSALVLFLCPALLLADQVVLKNGDTLTGKIIKKDGDKLTFKSEFLGEVSMPWSAVKSVTSDEPVTVILPGNVSVSGKVSTSDDKLQVAAPTPQSAPLSAVANIRNPQEQHTWERLQHPGVLELWSGFFDIGLALARGNARTDTLTTAASASRVSSKGKITVNFSQIRATARSNGITDTIASAIHAGWTYNRDISSRVFVTTMNAYDHDRFQQLDLRTVLGGGFGFNAVKTESTVLSFSGLADYERENFQQGLHRNSAEASFGDDLLDKISSVSSITQSFRMFENLSDTGAYRINFDLSGVTVLRKWLAWHITASDRYLSNPLLGRQRNDVLLSTGLRVSFAR
jgi:hypothetical protein